MKWNRQSLILCCSLVVYLVLLSYIYSCSFPQLNTLRVTQYVHQHLYTKMMYKVLQIQLVLTVQIQSTLHWVRGLRAQLFSVTPPCRQPHSIFGRFLFPFPEMRFFMSGAYQYQWLRIIPTQQDIATFYYSLSILASVASTSDSN